MKTTTPEVSPKKIHPFREILVYMVVYAAKLLIRLPNKLLQILVQILRIILPGTEIKKALTDILNVLKEGPPDSLMLKNILLKSRAYEIKDQFETVIFSGTTKDYKQKTR